MRELLPLYEIEHANLNKRTTILILDFINRDDSLMHNIFYDHGTKLAD